MKTLQIIFLTFLLVTYSFASVKTYYSIGGSLGFDSNLPQNITEYPKLFGAPYISLKLKSTNAKNPLSLWGKCHYENYIEERSPVLNSPFVNTGLSLDFRTTNIDVLFDIDFASYLSNNFVSAKNRYQLQCDVFKPYSRNELFLKSNIMYNDYGDNNRDGFRLNVTPGFQWGFRVLKKNIFALRSITFDGLYEHNFAQSDTSSYFRTGGYLETECKLSIMTVSLSGGVEYKRFKGIKEHTLTYELINPQNQYYIGSLDIKIPIISSLIFFVKGKLRFKKSNYLPYQYDRHTIEASLLWRSSFIIGD